jgi:chromosome segregation ATPase
MTQNQKALEQTLAADNGATTERLVQLSDGQATLGSQIGVVASTTGQTALDLVQLTDTQATLERTLVGALNSHDETVAGRMSGVAADQLAIRDGLDNVSTTTDQLAKDLGTVSNTQQSIESAVKTSRDDLTTKLDAFAREQQLWQQRFDATQAQIESLATNLSAVEQRVATLQSSLRTSLEGLLGLVAANAEARLQFETTFGQGVEDIAETVTQLQQTQSSLQEQLDLIERGTQSQTEDIIAAIERLTRRSAELKVSNAQTQIESPMVDTPK